MQEDVPKLTHPPLFPLVGKKPAYSLRFVLCFFSTFVLRRKHVAVIKRKGLCVEARHTLVLCIHLLLQLLDLRVVDVVVIIHELVDGAVGCKLYNAVRDGLYELMVMA